MLSKCQQNLLHFLNCPSPPHTHTLTPSPVHSRYSVSLHFILYLSVPLSIFTLLLSHILSICFVFHFSFMSVSPTLFSLPLYLLFHLMSSFFHLHLFPSILLLSLCLSSLSPSLLFSLSPQTTRVEFDLPEYSVRRRYQDFDWLRIKLEETQPTHLIPVGRGRLPLFSALPSPLFLPSTAQNHNPGVTWAQHSRFKNYPSEFSQDWILNLDSWKSPPKQPKTWLRLRLSSVCATTLPSEVSQRPHSSKIGQTHI